MAGHATGGAQRTDARLSGAVGTAALSVGSDDAELIPRGVLQHARRPVARFRTRHERRAGSLHFVNEGLRVFHEEVEVNSSLGGLRFRNGLKGQERRSVRAPVSSLERDVRPPGRARSARVAEAERREQRRAGIQPGPRRSCFLEGAGWLAAGGLVAGQHAQADQHRSPNRH